MALLREKLRQVRELSEQARFAGRAFAVSPIEGDEATKAQILGALPCTRNGCAAQDYVVAGRSIGS